MSVYCHLTIVEVICPFCKKKFESALSASHHFPACKKYLRFRKTHTKLQYDVFMHTSWRRRLFYPEWSPTRRMILPGEKIVRCKKPDPEKEDKK